MNDNELPLGPWTGGVKLMINDEDKLLIDNAATASQNSTLVDDPVTVEAIRMNIINPLRKEALIESSKLRRVIQATHKNPVKHLNCEETHCYICDGGLFQCADCGAAEIEAEERVCTGSGVSQNFIKIPKTWAEAETMQKLGFAWLEANAPERLTDISKSLSEANAENERLRKELGGAEGLLRRVLQLVETRGDLQRFYDKITGLQAWDEELPYNCDACSTPGYGTNSKCECTQEKRTRKPRSGMSMMEQEALIAEKNTSDYYRKENMRLRKALTEISGMPVVSMSEAWKTVERVRSIVRAILSTPSKEGKSEDEWAPPVGSCPQCYTLDPYFIKTCISDDCPLAPSKEDKK